MKTSSAISKLQKSGFVVEKIGSFYIGTKPKNNKSVKFIDQDGQALCFHVGVTYAFHGDTTYLDNLTQAIKFIS